MSLRPAAIAPVPGATAQVAPAAFPKGCPVMRMRDELGAIYDDRMFASLYPHERFSYKHGGALYSNPPQFDELLDHLFRPVGSLFIEYRVALLLQFGDLRTYQIQAVEHATYSGAGVRRKRISERRPQALKACAPIPPKGIVVTYPQGRQYGANTIDQADPFSHQIVPLPNAPAFILIGFGGDRYHRAHARLAS